MLNVYEELGETSRRQILAELRTGPKNVTELVGTTGLKQPNVSNHLARMRTKGIVKANKIGRQVFYVLASPEVEAVVQAVFSQTENVPDNLNLEELAKQYARAAIQGDENSCTDILEVVLRAHLPLLEIYQDLLGPAMQWVGTWYKVEAIDEAQEHMASAITERMMSRTVQVTGPMKRHDKMAVLGCAPNSWHVIGLRMLSDYLRISGWRTLFLGANVPFHSFLATVKQHKPDMVLISCAASEGVGDSVDLIRRLNGLRMRRTPFLIGIGGYAVQQGPAPFIAAGADFVSNDLRTFAAELLPEIERSGTVPAASQKYIFSNGHDEMANLMANQNSV